MGPARVRLRRKANPVRGMTGRSAVSRTMGWHSWGMDDEPEKLPYSCGFCGESTVDDPRCVHISLSWDRSEGSQQLTIFNCGSY
jgi:hypothetical protein